MLKSCLSLAGLLLAAVAAVGCSKGGDATGAKAGGAELATARADYVLDAEPSGAKGVVEVRRDAKDGDEVVVVGRIGGSKAPFVEGLAAFTIVDPKLAPCKPDCGCPTPWDYCCDPGELLTHKATVKIAGDGGKPVEIDARQLLDAKELATVVVRGRASRDEAGNLTVLADGLYVRP